MVNRVLKCGLVAGACILPALLGISPANAVSWSEKGGDGKVCRVLVLPHIHFGLGGVKPTKSAAQAAAIKRWSSFTVWEYGKVWGQFSLARDASVSCSRAYRGGWRCLATGQPCKN